MTARAGGVNGGRGPTALSAQRAGAGRKKMALPSWANRVGCAGPRSSRRGRRPTRERGEGEEVGRARVVRAGTRPSWSGKEKGRWVLVRREKRKVLTFSFNFG